MIKQNANGCLQPCLAVLCMTFLLSSCAMLNPAIGGKTHLHMLYSDVTGPTTDADGAIITPSETITFKNDSSLAAGVNIADAASAHVTADGKGWTMDINGSKQANTQGQAEANVAVTDATIQALANALNILAPALGQALDAKVQEGQLKAGIVNHAIDTAGAAAPALIGKGKATK